MSHFGFARVACAVPALRLADCAYNSLQVARLLSAAEQEEVSLVVFPELCLTGYTCGDLFQQHVLQRAAVDALAFVAESSRDYHGVAIVGLPLAVDGQLYNAAAVLSQGAVKGIVPKSYLPNYKEFYEQRWFAQAASACMHSIPLFGSPVPFGADLLFRVFDDFTLGVEICEDLWMPIPPSSRQALRGATVLANPSASNDLIGKAAYRRQLVEQQSARCLAAYVYTSTGVHESTTDIVYGGHCMIAENGVLLAESPRFERDDVLLIADIDLERLQGERQRTISFGQAQRDANGAHRLVAAPVARPERTRPLARTIEGSPFVPTSEELLRERCDEIVHIQMTGLARRLEQIGCPDVAIGVSGGLDSTHALLVTCKTFDLLGQPRSKIHALTMPGFGTSERTKSNAANLMNHLQVDSQEIDIRPLCLEEMRLLRHRPFGIDLTGLDVAAFVDRLARLGDHGPDLVFENVQARTRTNLLMNRGFTVGTGDLSELALGWCTYNADHMSMYNPNVSIPKTLVKCLVNWMAEHEFAGEVRVLLQDILATEISPELLPTSQATEHVIGPYELHDFFLFYFLRHGFAPAKILFLAKQVKFARTYDAAELRRWLRVFLQRFFANQFKRSCLPDGPKVGSVSLSPRGDWRMPSDAQSAEWLKSLE